MRIHRTQAAVPEAQAAARTDIHSFIVKVWIVRDGQIAWRGYVTHVPGGERRSIRSLPDLYFSMMSYMEVLGVRFHPCLRANRALYQWVHRRNSKSWCNDGMADP